MTDPIDERGCRSASGRHWIARSGLRYPLNAEATIDTRDRVRGVDVGRDELVSKDARRAYDEVAKARESGIEEGRAQTWDRLCWLLPVAVVVGFIVGLLLGFHTWRD